MRLPRRRDFDGAQMHVSARGILVGRCSHLRLPLSRGIWRSQLKMIPQCQKRSFTARHSCFPRHWKHAAKSIQKAGQQPDVGKSRRTSNVHQQASKRASEPAKEEGNSRAGACPSLVRRITFLARAAEMGGRWWNMHQMRRRDSTKGNQRKRGCV